MAWLTVGAWSAVALCAVGSFFFALAETALLSLGEFRIQQLVQAHPVAGRRVRLLLRDPNDLLATIALGSTLANAGLVTLVLLLALDQDWPRLLAMLGLLPVLLIGCEVVPKTLAVRAPETWAARVAGPFVGVFRLTQPVRRVAQALARNLLRLLVPTRIRPNREISEAEYQELIELAFQQGTLARAEKEIILEIIKLDQKTARDVMKPRARMVSLPDDLSREELLAAARRHQHRRLPLYDETPDTIVGILNARALLLQPDVDLAEVIEFPSFVPETMNLLQLLQSFQRQKRGLAVVLDEYGGTAGLVTMTDILAELIGEIPGEDEPGEQEAEPLGPGRWLVKGTMFIEDFRRLYPGLQEPARVDTMAGLLISRLEIVPPPGQSVVVDGLRLTARETDARRVKRLLVEVVQPRKGVGGGTA